MGWGAPFAEGLRPIADLLYPPRCPLCGEGIEAQSGLCAACWSGLAIPGEPACVSCQRPLGADALAATICGPCLADPPRHAGIAAATLYNDTSRQLVLRFKHGGRIALAAMMARLMFARLGELPPSALLVPVPLHRWRIWRRGYNQAALLARAIGRLAETEVCLDALERVKQTPSLGGLGRRARERALSGAILPRARRQQTWQGRDVILVDDVLTSGATTDACTRVLLRSGAASVRIACFARVLDEALPSQILLPENETPEAARTSGAT
jgi:ComF family protein